MLLDSAWKGLSLLLDLQPGGHGLRNLAFFWWKSQTTHEAAYWSALACSPNAYTQPGKGAC